MSSASPKGATHSMTTKRISRRHILQGSAALTTGALVGVRPAFAADTTIGFIYVGSRDDYGYNQAHAQGAAALKKLPGIKVVEEEKVPETDAVEKTIESMIGNGHHCARHRLRHWGQRDLPGEARMAGDGR